MRGLAVALAILVTTAPAMATPPAHLRVWQLSLRPALAAELARDFERREPGVSVDLETLSWDDGFQKLVLSFASRHPPDVFELGSTWIPQFRRARVLAPLDAVAASLGTKLLLPAPGEEAGHVDALPWLLGTRAMFVNRTLLRKGGLTEPPGSTAELVAFCQGYARATQNAPCIGLAAGDPYAGWQQFLSFAWSDDPMLFGRTIESGDVRKTAFMRAAKLYETLRPFAFADRPSVLDRRFSQGTLPLVISGAWLPLVLRDAAPDLDYSVVPVPGPGETPHAFAGGEYLVISKSASNPALAARFVRFLLERGTMARVTAAQPGLLAARTDAGDVPGLDAKTSAARMALQHALGTAVAPPSDPAWAAAEPALSSIADGLLLNGEPAPVAVARTERLLSEAIAASGAKAGSPQLAVTLLWLADAAGLLVLAVVVLRMRRSGDSWRSVAASTPWLALFAALSVLPIAYLCAVSFTSYDLLASTAAPAGMHNFAAIAAAPEFRHAIVVTAAFALLSVPATLALALLCAYGIWRLGRLARPVEFLVYLPPVLPVVVTASILSFLFVGSGPVDQLITAAGLRPPNPPWLVNPSWALLIVVLHAVWTSFGYYALFFLSGLAAIPATVREAADLDGAGPLQCFREIDWPALRGIAAVCAAIQTIRSLQVFPEILILTGGGPVGATTTIVYSLYEEAFRRFDFGRAAAIATMLMAAIVLLSIPLLWRRAEAR